MKNNKNMENINTVWDLKKKYKDGEITRGEKHEWMKDYRKNYRTLKKYVKKI